MIRVHVEHSGITDLARDLRRIPVIAARDVRDTVRQGAIVGNTVARDNARRTAGRHGKHYPRSFTWEMTPSLFGGIGAAAEYGPNPGRKQGRMSFEYGSRNQPPHLDLAKSADLIGPAFAQEISQQVGSWFWPGK